MAESWLKHLPYIAAGFDLDDVHFQESFFQNMSSSGRRHYWLRVIHNHVMQKAQAL